MKKREMLSERTGFNITNAIMVNKIMNDEEEKPAEAAKQRRVPVEEEKTDTKAEPKRRIIVNEK